MKKRITDIKDVIVGDRVKLFGVVGLLKVVNIDDSDVIYGCRLMVESKFGPEDFWAYDKEFDFAWRYLSDWPDNPTDGRMHFYRDLNRDIWTFTPAIQGSNPVGPLWSRVHAGTYRLMLRYEAVHCYSDVLPLTELLEPDGGDRVPGGLEFEL